MICVICQDDILDDRLDLPGCLHPFHSKCIVPWLQRHNQCPVCRYEPQDNTSETQDISEEWTEWLETILELQNIRRKNMQTGFRIIRQPNNKKFKNIWEKYNNHRGSVQKCNKEICDIKKELIAFRKSEKYVEIQEDLKNINYRLKCANKQKRRNTKLLNNQRKRIEHIGANWRNREITTPT
jgi:hypothetical protein